MQQLTIPYLPGMPRQMSADELVAKMQPLQQYSLAYQPWPQYATDASTLFAIAYTEHSILLQYQVLERELRAENNTINSPVYEDSCVEFFIAINGHNYYNFEFNCMGTILGAYGSGKEQREFLAEQELRSITTNSKLNQMENGLYTWRLLIQIPFSVFQHHPQQHWSGLQCTGNFYKCGDGLTQPHFLSWTPINTPEPNFHLRQFFGHLQFERQ